MRLENALPSSNCVSQQEGNDIYAEIEEKLNQHQAKFESIPVTTVKQAYAMIRQGYWLLPANKLGWYWYILRAGVVCVETPFSSYGCGISRIAKVLDSQTKLWATRRKA